MRIRVVVGFMTLLPAWGCFGAHPTSGGDDTVSTAPDSMGGAGSAAMQPDFHNPTPLPDRGPLVPRYDLPDMPIGLVPPAAGAGKGEIVTEFASDANDEWLTLLEVDWELGARAEDHLCARVRVPRAMYLHEFVPISPLGTHHTQLAVHDAGSGQAGVTSCGPDGAGHHIFGAGVASEPLTLPDGIAMRIEEGQELLLNLHLFNVGDETLTGRSGVRVRTMAEADVENLAEIVLAGPIGLIIPPGRVTQSGQCTFGGDATIFNLGPHMHQLGVHLRAVAQTQAGEVMLYDDGYDFDSQQRHPVDFVQMHAGDVVHVECTYQNDTDRSVGWGQSSLDEMCFASMMRFPPLGGYLCSN